MSVPVADDALEPLASPTLGRRLPHLATALDPEAMRGRLQAHLLDGTGIVAEACGRPRAELDGDRCGFQYPLRVRTPRGVLRELLVAGEMHRTPGAAAWAAHRALALAARHPSPPPPAPRPAGLVEELCMAVSVFPTIPALPTLAEAADARRMSTVLRTPVAGIDLVSLRRSGGAVLLYRLESGPDVFGKVGYAGAGDVLAALDGETLGVLWPRLLGRCATLDLLLISRVPGRRPALRDPAGLGAAGDAGALAAAALHTSGIGAGAPRRLEEEIARAARAATEVGADAPDLASRLHGALEHAGAVAAGTAAQPPALAHGDLTPSQLLLDGASVGLVDLDGACQAEPAFDLGRFLAYLRVAAAKSGAAATTGLGARLLDAYRAAGGPPVDARRVDAWATASLVGIATHSWRELKAGRMRLACVVLDEEPAGRS